MSVHVTSQATVESEQGYSLDYPRIGYINYARDGDVSASTEDTDYPADAVQSADTWNKWKPTANPSWLMADLGGALSVNYVGIASHNLSEITPNVRVQYSSNGTSWSNASDAISPEDDSAIMFLFPAQSARYWRLYIDGVGSPTVGPSAMPQIASFYVGSVLVMPRRIYGGHKPLTLCRTTTMNGNKSGGGHFLGQSIKRRGFATGANFRYLDPTWYRTTFDPFVQAARRYPYFFAWRPGDWPDEVGYCWNDGDIQPVNMGVRGFMQVNWDMEAFDDG